MICLYFDYEYEDMPMGDWTTNCFDGRLCEEDYAEKIVDFLVFIARGHDKRIPSYTPQWIYSSNEDNPLPYRFFWGGPHIANCLDSLIQWGSMLDNFLKDRNDYLQLDFLANAIHENEKCNTYHFLRSYSLCQLLLEKDKESELDWKLPMFLDDCYSTDEKNHIALVVSAHVVRQVAWIIPSGCAYLAGFIVAAGQPNSLAVFSPHMMFHLRKCKTAPCQRIRG